MSSLPPPPAISVEGAAVSVPVEPVLASKVAPLAARMAADPADATAVAESAAALRLLLTAASDNGGDCAEHSVRDATTQACIDTGAVDALVAALDAHGGSRALCEDVVSCLASIALNDAGEAACVSSGAVEALMGIIQKPLLPSALLAEALHCLFYMTFSAAGCAAAHASGAVAATIAVLGASTEASAAEDGSDSADAAAEVRARACELACGLARTPLGTADREELILVLIPIISRGAPPSGILSGTGFSALCKSLDALKEIFYFDSSFSKSDAASDVAAETLPLLMGVLRTFVGRSSDVVESAARTLRAVLVRNMSAGDNTTAAAVAAGIIPLLVSALRAHICSEETCQEVCRALVGFVLGITDRDSMHVALQAGVVEALLEALAAHPDNAFICHKVCEGLFFCGDRLGDPEWLFSSQRTAVGGVAAPLLSLINRHLPSFSTSRRSVILVTWACKALGRIVPVQKHCRDQTVAAGAISTALSLLKV